ncbi:uncharacterized protein EDB91DRAFT_1251574 [Suillus paluster]|uniref:uncharacterized protein n=1 Tax=Suillus paluster TaxID=48578 RepID=UPI001B86B638|nr:uncharacterized protein EDB91DRAFT_1251574 [Suillus paluster]KAG1733080.1 hypothetical protein EDB91DRAFT_1251574 [Suillus paluster]
MRHGVYRPELHIRSLQDGELQTSRKNMFKYPDDEVVDSPQSVKSQQPIEVAVEMNSFSSA